MKVFLSWSGEQSRAVAVALRDWLPCVIQAIEPWMSKKDIPPGARWGNDLQEQLKQTKVGILVVTRSNCNAPWLLFEAGALAKTIDKTYVCPYLLGMKVADLPAGPLTQFQATEANKEGTYEIIQGLNEALLDESIPDESLERVFEKFWPDLKGQLAQLPPDSETPAELPSSDEKLNEILSSVRAIAREPARAEAAGMPAREILSRFAQEYRSALYDLKEYQEWLRICHGRSEDFQLACRGQNILGELDVRVKLFENVQARYPSLFRR
ncbi:MAG: toll/interleukin-1 receptor domain-containing protein [Pirellulales bacterium]|nr:toll/interleukin-1 receptor domain-containing protein [Pirellulales bacterium]